MSTLITKLPSIEALLDSSPKQYELHQLCAWGADTGYHDTSSCSCARMIRVRLGRAVAAFVLEPTATQDEFWAAQEWLAETDAGVLVLGLALWDSALAQC